MPSLHVGQVNFFPAPEGLGLEALLRRWHSLTDIADAVASADVRVTVVQTGDRVEQLQRDGIDYHMVDVREAKGAGRAAIIAQPLVRAGVDVLHVHSLGAAADAQALSNTLPRVPVLLQDHADRVPRWWQRWRWRRWLAVAQGVAFTAPELAAPYVSARLFTPATRVFAIPESTSRFTPGDLAQARVETGLHGDPCVVWVGHLQAGKDPLTVLDGIAKASESLPGLRLWCAYGTAPLQEEVRRRIDGDARLSGRVHLLGKLAHEQIETLMRAADVFVSGSHAESCGYALLEAMACGAVPVVTDIPSFRSLVGEAGALWPPGDAAALASALLKAAEQRISRSNVRAHFDETLSPAAIGRRWAAAYAELVSDVRERTP